MFRLLLASTAAAFWPLAVLSCADDAQTRPAGPTSESSAMPWNTPVPGQGQGQFGMMPQNQHRR